MRQLLWVGVGVTVLGLLWTYFLTIVPPISKEYISLGAVLIVLFGLLLVIASVFET